MHSLIPFSPYCPKSTVKDPSLIGGVLFKNPGHARNI
ncbi:hypothetical protein V6Z12_D06G136800 [Gossypium hirsutum]